MTKKNKQKSIFASLWRLVKIVVAAIIAVFLFILGMIVVIILSIAIYNKWTYYKYDKFRQSQPFDSVSWQKTVPQEVGDSEVYTRCYMYKDLVRDYLYFGMSYEDTIKLLGPSDSDWTAYSTNPELKEIYYHVGYCTMSFNFEVGGADNYRLLLVFDRDLKLVKFGYHNAWQEKKGINFKNARRLFSCLGDTCKRSEVNSQGFIRWESCKKEEVESKWGYKVW